MSGDDPALKLVKELGISAVCIVGGVIMASLKKCPQLTTPGLLLVFFGAQTGMNMYMKAVFSSATVLDPAPDEYCAHVAAGEPCQWMGFQASFFVTGLQQACGFFIFWLFYLPLKALGFNKLGDKVIEIKKLSSRNEVVAVLCFAASFTMNIALNNMSMALIPLTLNLIIRSCLPLSTFVAQWLLAKYSTGEGKPCKIIEISLMLLGAAAMCVSVWAKVAAEAAGESSAKAGSGESAKTVVGVVYCVVSLFSGSVNLALAGMLKTSVKLDAFNAVVYNSLPAAIILLPFVFILEHPVKHWAGVDGYKTDAWIVAQVWENSKSTFIFGASSAVASLVYNILQFSIVQYLSATHVAFAGNFNKAATVPLALLVGIDHLPQAPYGLIMVSAAVVNIFAFAAYNVVTGGAGGHGGGGGSSKEKEKEPINSKDAESSDGEDDDDESSSDEGRCC
jgi:hypothetical protein